MSHVEELFEAAPVPGDILLNVVIVLDVSASMRPAWPQTLSGLNEYIDSLRSRDGQNHIRHSMTLITFGEKVSTPYNKVSLDELPRFTEDNLAPNEGSTSLYDGVGTAIKTIENESGAILMVVLTDGVENSSRQYTSDQVTQMRAAKESEGGWTFVYLGAEPAAWGASAMFAAAGSSLRGSVQTRSMDLEHLKHATTSYTVSLGAMNANGGLVYHNSSTGAQRLAYSSSNFFGDSIATDGTISPSSSNDTDTQ